MNIEIEKEFIEKHLGQSLKSIEVERGTQPGDNYASNIYAIRAYTHESEEPFKLFLKVFPNHPDRQRSLKMFNVFVKELDAYEKIVPGLVNYQKGDKIVCPKFPKFIAGEAVNFKDKSNEDRKIEIYENFIMMEDIKAQGFSMANRIKGLDFEQAALAIKELAKLHAVSWGLSVAQKQSITEIFPLSAEGGFRQEFISEFDGMIIGNYKKMLKVIEEELGAGSEIYKGAARLYDHNPSGILIEYMNPSKLDHFKMSKYIRASISSSKELKSFTNDPWFVLCHGDSHTNNMLFRYENEKVIEACILDLQMMRSGCLSTELVYFLYASVPPQIIKAREEEILQIYFDTFNDVCQTVEVELLPGGFTFDNLKKRYHNSKLLGFILVAGFLPMVMAEHVEDLDASADEASMQEIFLKISNSKSDCLKQRLLAFAAFAFEDGII